MRVNAEVAKLADANGAGSECYRHIKPADALAFLNELRRNKA
jgi:hypothetical protein